MKLSIIIPIYNEEDNIPELYSRIRKALINDFKKCKYEIIFIDDGSTDSSITKLINLRKKDKFIKIIQFSRNFGHHIAITAGLDFSTGDIVVTMDGDLQDRPEEIINLYVKLKQGFEIVYADRIDKQHSFFKRINSYIFNKTIKFLVSEDIVINSTIFRMMTKQVVSNIKTMRENNRYLIGMIGWVGFNSASQKVAHDKRFSGKSKYNFSRQIELALNAVFSFSNKPIKIGLKIGIIVLFLSAALAIFALFRKIVFETAFVGWTSILITILAIGGVQIILLGIISEYIGRIYIETKERPIYIIKKKLF